MDITEEIPPNMSRNETNNRTTRTILLSVPDQPPGDTTDHNNTHVFNDVLNLNHTVSSVLQEAVVKYDPFPAVTCILCVVTALLGMAAHFLLLVLVGKSKFDLTFKSLFRTQIYNNLMNCCCVLAIGLVIGSEETLRLDTREVLCQHLFTGYITLELSYNLSLLLIAATRILYVFCPIFIFHLPQTVLNYVLHASWIVFLILVWIGVYISGYTGTSPYDMCVHSQDVKQLERINRSERSRKQQPLVWVIIYNGLVVISCLFYIPIIIKKVTKVIPSPKNVRRRLATIEGSMAQLVVAVMVTCRVLLFRLITRIVPHVIH